MTPKERSSPYKIQILSKISLFMLMTIACMAKSNRMAGQALPDVLPSRERVYVHLDKQVYVAGESIRYKVYILNGTSHIDAPCSKILYFNLVDAFGKNQADWRINLDRGLVSGNFIIPAGIHAGIYHLRAYTNYMRNDPANRIYSQNLLIVNLSKATPDTLMSILDESAPDQYQPEAKEERSAVVVKTLKDTYPVGETVHLEIRLEGREIADTCADLSVSVSLVTPFQKLIPETDIMDCLNTLNQTVKAGEPCKYRLEDRSFILSGRIRNRSTYAPLVNARILLSVADSNAPKIRYTTTDSDGEYHFYLNRLFDNKELIMQFGDNSKKADCIWEIYPKLLDGDPDPPVPYLLKEEEIAFLNAEKDLRLIEAIYEGEKAIKIEGDDMQYSNFFSPADVIVIPSAFSDLVNFKEIADNIIPCVKFMNRDNTFLLQVLNERTNVWQENRWVLLNGLPYTDFNYIATLGTKDIKRIEVITRNYLLGDLTLPGLVSIYTFDNKIPENYLGNHTVRYMNAVIPNDPENEEHHVKPAGAYDPDFRSTLYWNPQIHISGEEALAVQFPASQLKGLYAVKVRGIAGHVRAIRTDALFEVR